MQERRRQEQVNKARNKLSKSLAISPSTFEVDEEDHFNESRLAKNMSVFSASRVNLLVPKLANQTIDAEPMKQLITHES